MGHPQLQSVLRHAVALAASRPGAGSDAELVRRFADDRDDAAFAELVHRHGPMVWGVCRNMLPRDADAEDAFQATFLALVRAAGSIRSADRLAGWLHGVAVRVALKARRASAHRRRREQAAAGGEATDPVPEAAWDDLLAAVHEEVQQLPESLRSAFVLCGLEGVRQPEAAARLGCTPGTLTVRLTRARRRLIEGLARRGIAPAVAGSAVAAGAATGLASVPVTVLSRAADVARPATLISPNVLFLTQGVIEMNTRTKWLAAAFLAAVGFAMTAGTAFINPASAQRPASEAQPPERGKRGDFGRGREPGGPPGPATGGFGAGIAGPMRGWEYKVVSGLLNTSRAEAEMNKLGDQGWELCVAGESGTLVFKRPKVTSPMRRGFGAAFGSTAESGEGSGSGGTAGSWAGGLGGFGGRPSGPPTGRPSDPPPGPGTPAVPAGRPSGERDARGGGGGTPGGPLPRARAGETLVVQLKNANASDLSTILREVFHTTPGVITIVPDQRTNSLILGGDAGNLKAVQNLIERLDVADDRSRKR